MRRRRHLDASLPVSLGRRTFIIDEVIICHSEPDYGKYVDALRRQIKYLNSSQYFIERSIKLINKLIDHNTSFHVATLALACNSHLSGDPDPVPLVLTRVHGVVRCSGSGWGVLWRRERVCVAVSVGLAADR